VAHLVDAVGDSLADAQRHDPRSQSLEHGRVEMAAVRGDRMAGRDDPGALHPTLVDGAPQCDIQEVAASLDHQAQVADRREPGQQGLAGVDRRAQRPVRRVVLNAVHRQRQTRRGLRSADHEV
jgi:hypothetical protein